MKQSIIKKATSVFVASAMALSLSLSASAKNFDTSASRELSESVLSTENSYAHMTYPNPLNQGTRLVLTSDYVRSGTKYTLTTYYGCVKNDYKYRYARSKMMDKKGNRLDLEYNYVDAEDITVKAEIDNQKFDKNSKITESFGKCTLYNEGSFGLNGDCDMTCNFIFSDINNNN